MDESEHSQVSNFKSIEDRQSIPVNAGYNDTIIDEQICSKKHLLYGPHAYKAERGAMLHPVTICNEVLGPIQTPFWFFHWGYEYWNVSMMSLFENPYHVNHDTPNDTPLVENTSKADKMFTKEMYLGTLPLIWDASECMQRKAGDVYENVFEEYLVVGSMPGPCILLCDRKKLSHAYAPNLRWYFSRETAIFNSEMYEDNDVLSGSGRYIFYKEKHKMMAVELTEAKIETIQSWARSNLSRNPMANKFLIDPDEEFLSESELTKRFHTFVTENGCIIFTTIWQREQQLQRHTKVLRVQRVSIVSGVICALVL